MTKKYFYKAHIETEKGIIVTFEKVLKPNFLESILLK